MHTFGQIDIVANNAGIVDETHYENTVDINVVSCYYMYSLKENDNYLYHLSIFYDSNAAYHQADLFMLVI